MNKIDTIKQGQMEKLVKLQSGDYSKIEPNWAAIYLVFAICCLIIGYVLITR